MKALTQLKLNIVAIFLATTPLAYAQNIFNLEDVEPKATSSSSRIVKINKEDFPKNIEELYSIQEKKRQEMARSIELRQEAIRRNQLEKFKEEDAVRQAMLDLQRERKAKEEEIYFEKEKALAAERERKLALEKEKKLALEKERKLALEMEKELDLQRDKKLALEKEKQLELQKEKQLAWEAARQEKLNWEIANKKVAIKVPSDKNVVNDVEVLKAQVEEQQKLLKDNNELLKTLTEQLQRPEVKKALESEKKPEKIKIY